ncbi:hypothetical protein D9M70_519660 [compost metagenome]
MVREGAIAAGADDPEGRGRTFRGEVSADLGGQFLLGHARADLGKRRLHGAVGDAGVHLQKRVFALVLAHAQGAERCRGEFARGILRQRIDQQQGEIGAHGLVEHDAARCSRADIGEGRRQSIGWAHVISPVVEGDVGVFARALGVERRHQEGFLFRADQKQAGALVRMRMVADQPIHVRSGRERDEADFAFGHLAAERSKTALGEFVHGVSSSGLRMRSPFTRL